MPRPRTRDEDNRWCLESDPRKRKQIQDRLAQRARRQRLADQLRAALPETSDTPPALDKDNATNAIALTIPRSPSPLSARVVFPLPIRSTFLDTTASLPQELHLDIPPSVFSALFTNGLILSLPCANASTVPSVSPPAPHAPADLRPTDVQLLIPHARWIDRFPFPRMRDNFITMAEVIDQELFLGDLFCMESFVIKAGGKAWVGEDWRLGGEFGGKWGFLFC